MEFTLNEGLYEQVINDEIQNELDAKKDQFTSFVVDMDEAESSKMLSAYTSKALEELLEGVSKVEKKVEIVNKIMSVIAEYSDDDLTNEQVIVDDNKVKLLSAVVNNINSKYGLSHKTLIRPETSISKSSLFTGAINEPSIQNEFCKEIATADHIDMLVSFVKWSGFALIRDALRDFTYRGGKLRIISTTYMGATDAKAIFELAQFPNTQIKISYDTKRTRLHAKTYVFYRNTGFTTAYVGSSNLSNSAMSSGLEWNMKITEQDLPDTFKKINASFETYWNTKEFELFTSDEYSRLKNALDSEKYKGKGYSDKPLAYNFTIAPYSYQQEVLDQLAAERELRGHYRNLIVAATGTGKTVISAFDYKRFVQKNPGKVNRLLFVAHREEILKQSIACYRGVLHDQNFGDLLVGKYQDPDSIDHLFVSIASLNSKHLIEKTKPDFYDFIVVDESHHDAAPSYQKLLTYYKPKILLGMTATPERMDGKSILPYFDGRIASEIRLPEAINRKLLAPFQYFCVTDIIDLSQLAWKNGGYVISELEKAYLGDSVKAMQRAETILNAIDRYVADLRDVKGIGFCASIAHAEYMNNYFNQQGIKSEMLTGDSDDLTRNSVAKRLSDGKIKFIFVVDLYNEGVDIPEVNTILFLRPTESLTVFLQQLGRGLRLCEGKEYLTVLDFIGQANEKYNYEERFTALLEKTHRDIRNEITSGFVYLPKGCFIKMEKVAQEYVLNNIERAYKGSFSKLVISKMKTFTEDYREVLSLESFSRNTNIDIHDIYKSNTFYGYKALAGIVPQFEEPLYKNDIAKKAFRKFAWIDSRRWITFILNIIKENNPVLPAIASAEYRMLQMFQYTFWDKSAEECGFGTVLDGIKILKTNINCYKEFVELLEYRLSAIDFVDERVDLGFDSPLDLYCTYTRDQLFVACDYLSPKNIREGVKYFPEKKLDIFLITLNKADKDYSPSTFYDDYSISDWEFHWQSQSTTSSNSVTGQRYINHKKMNSKIALFVRKYKHRDNKSSNEREPYVFLGTASYVSHSGSKPMSIIWKLDKPIPGKFRRDAKKLLDD